MPGAFAHITAVNVASSQQGAAEVKHASEREKGFSSK